VSVYKPLNSGIKTSTPRVTDSQ